MCCTCTVALREASCHTASDASSAVLERHPKVELQHRADMLKQQRAG